jgi:hypothetical protein
MRGLHPQQGTWLELARYVASHATRMGACRTRARACTPFDSESTGHRNHAELAGSLACGTAPHTVCSVAVLHGGVESTTCARLVSIDTRLISIKHSQKYLKSPPRTTVSSK